MKTIRLEIKHVSRRIGLNPHRIRAWERRHQAVIPPRTATQRRRYTETDLQRRQLLRQAVESGHRISDIARMTPEDLRMRAGRNYLGQSPVSLPVAFHKTGARGAAISITSASGSEKSFTEVCRAGQLLRGRATVLAGGHAAPSSRAGLRETAIGGCDNLEAFHSASGDEALPDRGLNT